MRELLIKLRGNIPQTKVAKDLEISQQFLSCLENGSRNPSIKMMKKCAAYYGKSIIELFPDIFLTDSTTKCCGKLNKEVV